MKLIFVNRFYAPDISATSQMLTDAAQHLAKGHDVHVVTSRLSYEGDEVFSASENIQGVKIHRIWTTRFGRGHMVGRTLDYLSFYVGVFFKLMRLATRNDIVVAKTDPPMVSIPANWAAALKGARLVNWLQDLFPEVVSALGMRLPGTVTSILRWARNASLRRARFNIAIGETMRDRLIDEGVYPDRVVVVPNWSDGDMIVPKEDNDLRREWDLRDVFVVGYSGNYGRAHDFDTVADTIERLLEDGSLRFLFVGGGMYMDEIRSRGYHNCTFKPYQPRERLPLSLTVPDIHLISLRPDLEGLILPSKVYGILAAGKPFINIGDPGGEVGRLVDEFKVGVNVASGHAGELCHAIKRLQQDVEGLQTMGRAARHLFDSRFGQGRSLHRLEECLCREN